ncbi:EAL domain-containing protein [Azotobacter chroococcum subsp. isscasi]|uniref:bifunctional diguanylate cyclase/phosphodiesterase n=1 Tax=Azotobacter chroococcum TaxID=353 RepID=UPI00103E86FD|nr:EAL domain-containing protein [Azotobacter chroococcum]TBW07617.1 EAL domain-containing protein [Azotobacter chroococcum subsp. isscasi]
MQKDKYFGNCRFWASLLLGGWILVYLFGNSLPPIGHFLILHQVLETASIMVSVLIFVVGWHTFKMHANHAILIVSCTFLGVAISDFSHMLSYTGMPDFFGSNSPEKAIGFWLLARYLTATGMLIMACLPWRVVASSHSVSTNKDRYAALLVTLLIMSLAILALLLFPEIIPKTYQEDVGLTPFKQGAEFAIIAIYCVSIALLLIRRRVDMGLETSLLVCSLSVMVMSEVFFTAYRNVTDAYNLFGHIYKIIAYVILYRAIFVESILAPYKSLEDSRQHIQVLMEALPDIILEARLDGLLLSAHVPADGRLFKTQDLEAGRYLQDSLPPQALGCLVRAMRAAEHDGQVSGLKFQLGSAGEELVFEVSASLLAHWPDERSHFMILIRDVTEQARNQSKIEQMAHFDALTGLPNRTLFNTRFDVEATRCEKNQQPMALIFMDLDNFKNVNDSLGHKVGDALLIKIASRLERILRPRDMVSRQGGDEFMFLLPEADAHLAGQMAECIKSSIERPLQVGQYTLHVAASMGICIFPQDGRDLDTLSSHADIAMYRAKHERRSHYEFFTEEMQSRTVRTLLLEGALREAIQWGQLDVYYQPQFDITGTRLEGAEALVRWQHPELGFISPAEFIPIAEVSGQIIKIGDLVLYKATQQMRHWLDEGFPGDMSMAVNISMAQFRDTALLEKIDRALADNELPPWSLELELTESVAMENPETVIEIVSSLRSRGVKLSIDDFGTGYSSLSYLKKLQVHKLKIDRSFIQAISAGSSDQSIVRAIIGLARDLDMQTIAEGIETEEQRRLLEALGCDSGQGYLFCKPLPAAEFLPRLLEHSVS